MFAAANEQETIPYHVTVHSDVSAALKSLSLSRADFFTVILLDALQPAEALDALSKFEIPIVMLLSEGSGPTVIRNCIRRGADACLEKPLQLEEVIRLVNMSAELEPPGQPSSAPLAAGRSAGAGGSNAAGGAPCAGAGCPPCAGAGASSVCGGRGSAGEGPSMGVPRANSGPVVHPDGDEDVRSVCKQQ